MRSLGNLTDFQKSTGWEKIVLAKSQWLRSYEQIIFWKSVFWLYLDLGTSDWGDLYCIRFLSSRRFFWGTMSKREKLTQDVDQRCYASTLPQRFVDALGSFFPFFDLYTIRRVLTRGIECNIDLLNPSSQTRAMTKSLPNAIAQRFLNASSMGRRWLLDLSSTDFNDL